MTTITNFTIARLAPFWWVPSWRYGSHCNGNQSFCPNVNSPDQIATSGASPH